MYYVCRFFGVNAAPGPVQGSVSPDFDTRVGTLDMTDPKLLSGPYLPDGLLERRSPAGRLVAAMQNA